MRSNAHWLMLALVGLGLAGSARAGVDPQPFHSDLGKLGAVENLLESAGQNLAGALLAHPPEPGFVGRVDALAKQVEVADGRVAVVLAANPPPDDTLVASLLAVRDDALVIVDLANGALHPPDPGAPPPEDQRLALEGVVVAGYDLSDRVDAYLLTGGTCSDGCDIAYQMCLASGYLPADCQTALNECSYGCSQADCDAGCNGDYKNCLATTGDEAVCSSQLDLCLTGCAPDTCTDDCSRAFESCQAIGGVSCAGDLEYCVAVCTMSPG